MYDILKMKMEICETNVKINNEPKYSRFRGRNTEWGRRNWSSM